MVRVPLIFASLFRPHRLAWPRTLPFQGSNTGSNPVGDTSETINSATRAVCRRFCLQESVAEFIELHFSGGFHATHFSSSQAPLVLSSLHHSSQASALLQGSCASPAKLKTDDSDEAKARSSQWNARVQPIFVSLKKHGARMTPAEIEALIANWMDSELEESEDY